MPVLDAAYLIDLQRVPERMASVVDRLLDRARERREALVVPLPAAVEFASGAQDPAEAFRLLEASYEVVPLTREVGVEAARVGRDARSAGHRPGWHDVDIAAFARHLGMEVVTRNARHFEALGCRVWDYSEGWG